MTALKREKYLMQLLMYIESLVMAIKALQEATQDHTLE